MLINADCWKITAKAPGVFAAKYKGNPVATVKITNSGKAWKFFNDDEMCSRVSGYDRFSILAFVLPMYGIAAPVNDIEVYEGDAFVDNVGKEFWVETVDPSFVECSTNGNNAVYRVPMALFKNRVISGRYKKIS